MRDQEIPRSHSADQPMVLRGRATEHLQSQDNRKTLKDNVKQPVLSSMAKLERALSNA